ncbi:MAG: TRAP transporter large permease subunit [Dehalococcoidia bacterium]|nr:MAG: TRAP transporter large permease subunit [Dehalococcoidia bacterium]
MENPWLIISIVFALILLFLASGMWISGALGLVGLILILFFAGGGAERGIGMVLFNTVGNFTFIAVPLFIFMGEIILHSGISERLYQGASSWVDFLPGGLLHTNIVSCSIFAAVSGSSMATAATIGTVATQELIKRGYNKKLLLGSLAAGGTLGILIPPSIAMIIYGVIVKESIGRLFIAGVFPGIVLSGLFMLYIGGATVLRPDLSPERLKFSIRRIGASLLNMWPILVLIFLVLGTIYLGIATPTEAAAMGATGALILCAVYKKLSLKIFKESAVNAVSITCWAMFIVLGAQILSMGLGLLKVPVQLAQSVASLPVERAVIELLIVILYIILGMFIEATSMMLLTIPIVFPIMTALGFDPVWTGVFIVIMIEMAQITPPVGINLYVIHGIAGKKYLSDIIIGVIPFVICQIITVILLTVFPGLALWLPTQMIKRF